MYEETQEIGLRERIKTLLFRAKNAVRKKPWLIAIAFFCALALYFFWYVFLAMLAIAVVSGLIIRFWFRGPSAKQLLDKKRVLQEELRIAEAKLLQHKIDMKDYQELIDRNQKQLVEIESQLSKQEGKQNPAGQKAEESLEGISSKKRHLMKELLSKKETIQDQIKIAEAKYYRRKISGETYKQILKEKQCELIRLEAEINKVYANESVELIKRELAEKLKEVGESAEKKRKDFVEQVAEDVADQVQWGNGEESQQEKKDSG